MLWLVVLTQLAARPRNRVRRLSTEIDLELVTTMLDSYYFLIRTKGDVYIEYIGVFGTEHVPCPVEWPAFRWEDFGG